MNYEEEIRYRENIMKRIRAGERILYEDKLWLLTHCVFNSKLGYPFLNVDIIQLRPKFKHDVCVKIEKLNNSKRIIPVFVVPGGKGEILSSTPLVDLKGNTTTKGVKALGLLLNFDHTESTFVCSSDVGAIAICYECDYYDNKQRLNIRKSSDTGDPNFAMVRENISDNKVKYKCKFPLSDSFDDFIFSVKWKLKN